MFCGKLCGMIIWFWHQIVSSFCYDKFNTSIFSHIFHTFSKTSIIDQVKKIDFNIAFVIFLRSVFILIYGFSQAFLLNLVTLWTFLKLIYDLILF